MTQAHRSCFSTMQMGKAYGWLSDLECPGKDLEATSSLEGTANEQIRSGLHQVTILPGQGFYRAESEEANVSTRELPGNTTPGSSTARAGRSGL